MNGEPGAGEGLIPEGHDAFLHIQLNLVACPDCVIEAVADNGGKADIDGISVEDPGEGRCQNGTNAQCLEDSGGLFAGRAAAEIAVRDDIIAGLYIRCEICIQRFECVSFHFIHSRIEKILGSDDLIGVHIFVKTEYFTHMELPVPGCIDSGDSGICQRIAADV